jgi:hypothetical protein
MLAPESSSLIWVPTLIIIFLARVCAREGTLAEVTQYGPFCM